MPKRVMSAEEKMRLVKRSSSSRPNTSTSFEGIINPKTRNINPTTTESSIGSDPIKHKGQKQKKPNKILPKKGKSKQPSKMLVQAKALNQIMKKGDMQSLCFRKLPFQRLVRYNAEKIMLEKHRALSGRYGQTEEVIPKLRFTKQAVSLIQNSVENRLIDLFQDATMCTLHAKRVTLFVKDIHLARRLRSEYNH